jgi:hypothetical protein
MSSEQSTPAMGQTGQLAARHRHQRAVIGAAGEPIEHVKPIPHCLPEHLAQNLIHLAAFPPPSRPRTENNVRDMRFWSRHLTVDNVGAWLNPSRAALRRSGVI